MFFTFHRLTTENDIKRRDMLRVVKRYIDRVRFWRYQGVREIQCGIRFIN